MLQNELAFLGPIAHFIQKNGQPTAIPLALPCQQGKHTCLNVAEAVGGTIVKFDPVTRFGVSLMLSQVA